MVVQTRRSSFAIPALPKPSPSINRSESSGQTRRISRLKKTNEDEPVLKATGGKENMESLAGPRNATPRQQDKSAAADLLVSKPMKHGAAKTLVATTVKGDSTLVPDDEARKDGSTREAATSKSLKTNSGHVPRDYTLDRVSDCLSIQDKPSRVPHSKSIRRRQSTSMLEFQQLSAPHIEKSARLQAKDKKSFPPKRSRQSLCHVPSPALLESSNVSVTEKPEPSKQPEKPSICLDEDYATVSTTQRKRRMSMFIPQPDTLPEVNAVKDSACFEEDHTNVSIDRKRRTSTVTSQRTLQEKIHSSDDASEKVSICMEDDDNIISTARRKRRTTMVLSQRETLSARTLDSKDAPEKLSICLDDDYDTVSTANRKRRTSMFIPRATEMDKVSGRQSLALPLVDTKPKSKKKRQSMVLPSEWESPKKRSSPNKTKRRQSIVLPADVDFPKEISSPMKAKSRQSTAESSELQDAAMSMKKRQSILLPSDVKSILSDSDTANTTTRRKKRQSIILPNDLGVIEEHETEERTAAGEFFQRLKTIDTIKESPLKLASVPGVAARPAQTNETLDCTDNSALRDMVRAYCSLPEACRNSSKVAEDIQQLTCYPLVPPTKKSADGDKRSTSADSRTMDLNWSSSPSDNAAQPPSAMDMRRQLLLQLGPLVQRIESRKAIDTKQMQDLTGCRVGKSKSKLRYYSVSTNTKVKAAEYKNRYLSALQEKKMSNNDQRMTWMECTREVESNPDDYQTSPDSERKPSSASIVKEEKEENDRSSSARSLVCEDVSTFESADIQDESMELCDPDESSVDMESLTPVIERATPDPPSPLASGEVDQPRSADSDPKPPAGENPLPIVSGSESGCKDGDSKMDLCDPDESLDAKTPGMESPLPSSPSRSGKNYVEFEQATEVGSANLSTKGLASKSDDNDEDMELCDPNDSMLDVEKSPLVVVDRAESNSRGAQKLSSESSSAETIPSKYTDDEGDHSADNEDGLLLPLPSREEGSRDPEIAAAEQRLWSAIDAALEAYSREVLAIQSVRQAGPTPEAQS